MTFLLFPGRHLLHTTFQARYLRGILQMPLEHLSFLEDYRPDLSDPLDRIIFAVTSANQEHTRYNPIPFSVRAIGVDRFARRLELTFGIRYRIIGIPHYRPTPRFAEYTLKEIEEQTEGRLRLTPQNCVILCSTPALIDQYRLLGFAILPAELGEPDPRPETPTALLQRFVAAGEEWRTDPALRIRLSPDTFDLWQDFPDIPRRVLRLWRDPLLSDSGDLTTERDYSAYSFGMGKQEIIELKYQDIKEVIKPGKIVDEGCADGALLIRVAEDFPDSDLIGIEVTGEFIARARERQRAGLFGGSFVHFHQRNIMQPIFEPNAIDTTICNSTVHELWSYGQGADSVQAYFKLKFDQTRPGGRLVIRDVVGPFGKEMEIAMELDRSDGRNEDVFRDFSDSDELEAHLNGLSTYARFLRFARDFLAEERAKGTRGQDSQIRYQEAEIEGKPVILLSLKDAVEFMSKKDYTANWASEMHEEFAFWDFLEWKAALIDSGFAIAEDPNDPGRGSHIFTNPWIVENRWAGKVRLFHHVAGRLTPLSYPPTNIILVGEKPFRQ